jgi:aryl carrier-like protein
MTVSFNFRSEWQGGATVTVYVIGAGVRAAAVCLAGWWQVMETTNQAVKRR